jgi:hypothetical protein
MMSDKKVQTYEMHLTAWSAISKDERARMIRDSLSEAIVFTNQQQTRRGLREVAEHLEDFQALSPGGSFRMNSMIGWVRMLWLNGSWSIPTVIPASPATTFSRLTEKVAS